MRKLRYREVKEFAKYLIQSSEQFNSVNTIHVLTLKMWKLSAEMINLPYSHSEDEARPCSGTLLKETDAFSTVF